MVNVSYSQESYNRIMESIKRLMNKIDDMTPIWEEFGKYYPKEIIEGAFNTRGKIFGTRWPSYNKKYLKWKQKHFSGKPMLVMTGKLKDDSTNNIKVDISKKNMSFTILNPLASIHHYNKKKPRKIIAGVGDRIPQRAINWLMEKMFEYIKAGWR